MNFLLSIFAFSIIILILFFFFSKNSNFDILFNSSFECGFTSYFFSRFSFSMHYFLIGMIFLFLDLELCYLMPFINESYSNFKVVSLFLSFTLILLFGLLKEWTEDMLEWKF